MPPQSPSSEERELLDALSASSPVGLFLADVQGQWTLANSTCREVCGLDADGDAALSWITRLHPDDRESVERTWNDAVSRGAAFTGQMRFALPDGAFRAVCMRTAPRASRDGTGMGFTGSVEDLGARLDDEAALHRSEERSRAQYQNIPLPTYTWQATGDDWILIDFNAAAEEFTRGTIRDQVGTSARTFFQHEPDILDDFAQCARDRTSLRREMTHRLGTTREVREIATHYAFVPPDLVMVHTEDISSQHELERARLHMLEAERLARTEAETAQRTLETILEHVPVGIVVVNAAGLLILVNEACRRISGVLPSEALPVADQAAQYALCDSQSGEPLAPADTPIARALAGESVNHMECVFRNPRSEMATWLNVSAVPLHGSDQAVVGAMAVFEDLTEQRAVEEQKDGFLSSAAHDLKTPLTTIKGFAQLLNRRLKREGALTEEYAAQYLDRIDATVRQMTEMITEMLDLTSLQMGEHVMLSPALMDLRELVESVVEEVVPTAERLRVRLELPEPQVEGVWDESRLRRVVSNLVTNAVTYSPDGGDISISLHSGLGGRGRVAILVVGDHGIGIPEDELPYIFKRFYRASNATARFVGTGIGLSGVKQIVDQHGGEISVQSSEGRGSTFTVTLPVASFGLSAVPD